MFVQLARSCTQSSGDLSRLFAYSNVLVFPNLIFRVVEFSG
jgi:hypothetical protein